MLRGGWPECLLLNGRLRRGAAMNCKRGIDENLVADGLLFTTSGHRCRYIGTSNREKARWLEDNKGNYQRVDDVLQRLGRPDNIGQNCETSSRDIRKDCGDGDNGSLAAPLPEQCSPPHQPTSRPEGVTVAHVVELLQTAYPKTWKQLLRNRLGATDPADLTLAEFGWIYRSRVLAGQANGHQRPRRLACIPGAARCYGGSGQTRVSVSRGEWRDRGPMEICRARGSPD